MANTYAYSKAETESKLQSTFSEIKQNVQAIGAGEGGKMYDSLAEAKAVTPKPANGTVFQVSVKTDPTNAGIYTYQAGEANGIRFEKPFPISESSLGLSILPVGYDILQIAASKPITDPFWTSGYLRSDGTVGNSSSIYYSDYIKAYPGEYAVFLELYGNARIVVYNKDKILLTSIANPNAPVYNFDIVLPDGTEWIRICTASISTSKIKGTVKDEIRIIENSVFVPEQSFLPRINFNRRDFIKSSNSYAPKTAIISFISDDGHIENNNWYVPVLDSKGVKGTFAIVTGRYDLANYFTADEVESLSNAGHDIASHTHTHEHMLQLTLNETDYILQKSKIELLKLNINAEMFISPFGERSVDIDKKIRQYYKTNFITVSDTQVSTGNCLNTPPIESYRLKRVSFDASQNGVSKLQICKDAVNLAINNGGWLVFAIHPHYAEYSSADNPAGYMERRGELSQLIDYIISLNTPILTAKQAYDFYKNKVEIGNVNVDEKYYALGMDGTEAGNYFD